MLQTIIIVIKKELKRVFSDRRLVMTNFILPMVSIALMYSVMGMMINGRIDQQETYQTRLLLAGAPAQFTALIEQTEDITWQELSTADQPNDLVVNGDFDAFIQFEKQFAEKLNDPSSGGAIPVVTALYSPKNDYLEQVKYKVNTLIEDYKAQVLSQRLGSAALLQVLQFDTAEVTLPDDNAQGLQGTIAGLIPMLITIFIFAGAMGTGMDLFAGEKERGTMATMLVTPASRSGIIIGKMVSLAIIALLSMTSSIVGVALSAPFSGAMFGGSGQALISGLSLSLTDYLLLALCLFGMVAVFVSAIATLSMFAKNVKEAGTYISPLYMVVMMMAFTSMFGGNDVKPYQLYTPVLANITNIRMILKGDANPYYIAIALISSLLVAGALIIAAQRMIHKEKIVFPEWKQYVKGCWLCQQKGLSGIAWQPF